MKKRIRKIVYALPLLSTLLVPSAAEAKLEFKSFNGVTKYFKKKSFSPVLGEVLLESGYMHNLRFNGNVTSAFNPDGTHNYAEDKGQDGLTKLAIILMPSPGGSLSAERVHILNFGNHVTKAESVAQLLKFVKSVREHLDSDEEITKGKDKLLDDLNVSMDLKKGIKKGSLRKDFNQKTLMPLIDAIVESIKQEKDSLYLEGATEQVITGFFDEKFNDRNDIEDLLKHLGGDIVDEEELKNFDKDDLLGLDDLPTIEKKQGPYDLDDIYALANASLFTSPTPYKSGTHLLSNGPAYPYDREKNQILFGAQTFSDCVEKFMNHVTNLMTFKAATKQFNINPILKYVDENSPGNPYIKNFIDFYAIQTPDKANNGDITMRSAWNRVVGDLNRPGDAIKVDYKKGTNEIISGFINFIKVFQKIFGLKINELPKEGFAKKKTWLEESLQTLFTALNPERTYTLDLAGLRETADELSGDIALTVSENNMALFKLDLSADYRVHSKAHNLQTLLKAEKDYIEVLGQHPTTVHANTTEESMWLLAPDTLLNDKVKNPLLTLFNHALTDSDSRINALKTLCSKYGGWKESGLISDSQTSVISTIVGHVLDDISWADAATLDAASPVIRELIEYGDFKEALQHKVKGIKHEFKNEETLKDIIASFPNLENLRLDHRVSKNESSNLGSLLNPCKDKLKNLFLGGNKFSKLELDTFPALENVTLATNNLESVSIKNAEKLKELDLKDTKVSRINLENMTSLERLDASFPTVTQVSLKNIPHLKVLNLDKSQVKKVDGLENLTALEILNLSETTQPLELNLSQLKLLKELRLQKSTVESIKGLEDLTSIEVLNFDKTNIKGSLTLRNQHHLKELMLDDSSFTSIHLENLPELKEFRPLSLAHLEALYLNNLNSLEIIILRSSPAKKIEFSNLPAVQTISLPSAKNIEDFSIKDLGSLKSLNLVGSSAKIVKLDNLSSMESLNVLGMDQLDEIHINKLNKLKEVNLRKSKVKKVILNHLDNLEKIDTALAESMVNFSLDGGGLLKSLGLQFQSQLETVSIKNARMLEDLYLDESAVKTVHLENLDSIKMIDLTGLEHLKRVVFSGTFKSLEEFRFSGSTNLEEIVVPESLIHHAKKATEYLPWRGKVRITSYEDDRLID